ncbi:MAG TPA: NAD(P)-binding protein [Anaeromyxobacteraceae bacterium]|jgi:phytoene dehydrogenase-like protein|nr:NAD(P)-binding protein [Anaeromyxobacteraceae bacterium]
MAQILKPPSTQRVYDVAVIGSQLGGAVAGALLARRGYRVLHIDHDGVGASYADGGYLLPYAPAILFGPRQTPAAEAALVELGLHVDVGRLLEPSAPDLQLLLPRHRVDVPRDPQARVRELEREWPADASRLAAALSSFERLFAAANPFLKEVPPLPPESPAERRALAKATRAGPAGPDGYADEARPFAGLEDHPFVAALLTSQRFLSYLDGEPSPFSLNRLLGCALHGTFRMPGGYEALRELIRRRIAESRGELLGGGDGPAAVVDAIELDGQKAVSVRLADHKDYFVARAFVLATDAPAVRRILPQGEAKLAPLLEAVKPHRQLLAVNLVVKKGALPPALGSTVVALRDPTGPDDLGNAVLLQVLPARRDTLRDARRGPGDLVPDERVVCAAGFVPADARERGVDFLQGVGQQVLAAVADAVPFFERHLVRKSIPALDAHERRGSRLLPHPLYQVTGEQALGVTGLQARTPYKNLFFAGREVLPGLGLEGEFHAGVQAAAAVTALLGKIVGRK